MTRFIEPIKENYETPNVSCEEEEGQLEKEQENDEAEDPLILVMADNEQEE